MTFLRLAQCSAEQNKPKLFFYNAFLFIICMKVIQFKCKPMQQSECLNESNVRDISAAF